LGFIKVAGIIPEKFNNNGNSLQLTTTTQQKTTQERERTFCHDVVYDGEAFKTHTKDVHV
jgi:hypothetical protein